MGECAWDVGQAAPVMLNFAMLRAHFNLPLNDAAKKLGVCATAIKKVRQTLVDR